MSNVQRLRNAGIDCGKTEWIEGFYTSLIVCTLWYSDILKSLVATERLPDPGIALP